MESNKKSPMFEKKAKADQICFWLAFVGSKGGIFGGFYSFLSICLEFSISFRIFANGKGYRYLHLS